MDSLHVNLYHDGFLFKYVNILVQLQFCLILPQKYPINTIDKTG